ncbi:GNAT family N-acetyltransferase [Beijerinckia sp. L45]|uniref:GNAT family N-acetyltransferase n=1 Tax=Beijerinckia sp. L45 TaxID=1641855 RepID=UPI00131AEF7A|nr:GNAT family N-acetyltransferase [Beijerinckia sp. L45]
MSAPSNIRPMRLDDMPACRVIAAECWSRFTAQVAEPEFREAFASSAWRPTFYIAERHGAVVGMAGYGTSWLSYGIYNLFWVAVRPHVQGRGIARQLVDQCLADLFPIADAVMLMTGVPEFYARGWGFESIGTVPQSEGFGDTLMVLRPNLRVAA